MTETARFNDLQELTLLWSDAGLPAAKIRPVVRALERSEKAAREAAEAEQASQAAARRVGERFASGELETFDAAMAEATRLGSWLAPVNAKASSYRGPAILEGCRAECHRMARTYIAEHAQELAELARAKPDANAERVLRWLQRFNYIAPPPDEMAEPEPVEVEGRTLTRRGDAIRWG